MPARHLPALFLATVALVSFSTASAQGGIEAYVTYYEYSYNARVLVVGQYIDHVRRPDPNLAEWTWSNDHYQMAAGTDRAFADAVEARMTRGDREAFCASLSCTGGATVRRHRSLADAERFRSEVMAEYRREGFDVFIVDFRHPGEEYAGRPERVVHRARISELEIPYYWAGYVEAKVGRENKTSGSGLVVEDRPRDRDDRDEVGGDDEYNPATYYALRCEEADRLYAWGNHQGALEIYASLEREGGLYLSADCLSRARERTSELQLSLAAEGTVTLLDAVSDAFGIHTGLAVGAVALDRGAGEGSSHMTGGISLGFNVVYVDLLLGDAAIGPFWLGAQTPEPPYYIGCDSWYDTDIEGNFCGDYYPEEEDYDWQVDYAVNVGLVSPLGLPLGEDLGLFPLGYVGHIRTQDDEALSQYGFGLVFGPGYGDWGGLPVFEGQGMRGTVSFGPGGTSWSIGWLLDLD